MALDFRDIEWFALEMNRDPSVVLEITSKYCTLESFCWLWWLLHFFSGIPAIVVDIMVFELNSPFPVHFSLLIPRMLTFTLAISCLTTSNLPWFMDLTFQVPIQYCSIQHWTLLLSPVTSTTGCCFCFGSILSFFLELFLHWFPVAYWAPTDLGGSSSVSYLLAFSYCSGGSQGKNTEVVCHSLLQWTTFCQTSPPWPVCLGWPCMAWLSFIELDKTVVHVIRLASFLWLWFQSVCLLMFSLSAFCLTWLVFSNLLTLSFVYIGVFLITNPPEIILHFFPEKYWQNADFMVVYFHLLNFGVV